MNTECLPFHGGGGGGEEPGDDGDAPPDNPSPPTYDYTWLESFMEWWYNSAWWQYYNDGPTGPGGPGGAAPTQGLDQWGYFDIGYFEGLDFSEALIAELVNDFRRRHGIIMNAAQLHDALQHCGMEEYLDYRNELFVPHSQLSDCIKQILLQNNLLHLQQEDGFTLTEEEAQAIYPDVMLYGGDFQAYKKTGLINYLKDLLGFGSAAEAWLNSQKFSYLVLVYEYLRDQGFSVEAKDTANALLELLGSQNFEFSISEFNWLLENADETLDNISAFLADNGTGEASLSVIYKAVSLSPVNFADALNTLHDLYQSLNDESLFDFVNAEQLQFFMENPDFTQLACVDGLLGNYSSCQEEDIGPVAIWLLKKAAQFGSGAIIDICIQIGLEKWLGGHETFPAAWAALDVNEWQVLGAAIDASISGKYAPIASTFTTVGSYLLSTPLEEITFQDIFQQAAVGALVGYIGSNAGSLVNKIRGYFPDYGFLIPYQGLSNMGIKPFFLNLPDFRRDAIFYVWRDLGSTTTKGFYFEEILSYSRYQGYSWVNGGGELNGPIDFFLDDLAVQLKSTQNASPAQWSTFLNNTVKPGLNQLKNAVDNGFQGNNFTQGRLDIMIPESLEGNIPQLESLIQNWLPTADNYANYNFEIIIGVFND